MKRLAPATGFNPWVAQKRLTEGGHLLLGGQRTSLLTIPFLTRLVSVLVSGLQSEQKVSLSVGFGVRLTFVRLVEPT
jgi:hypothetical protein